jgi:cephalosporin-C deacetylase
MRRYLSCILGVVLSLLVVAPLSAKGLLELRAECTNDWIYQDEAYFNIMLTAGQHGASGTVVLKIYTDKGEELKNLVRSYAIKAGEPQQLQFVIDDLGAGFYIAEIVDDGKSVKRFNFGVRPDDIISAKDGAEDLWSFWEQSLKELSEVAPEYKLTLMPKLSGSVRNVYEVEMKSWGGETIRGYWAVPKAAGKYPVVVTYMGYAARTWAPNANRNGDRCEFILSIRGQGLNTPYNTYGEWMCYGLDDKQHYYYRGAFMDTIRAIDFVLSQDVVDERCVLLEGGSQGGALTLAAASLDRRVAGAAPYVPFLGDFRDYFEIVDWPGNNFFAEAKRLGISNDQMFATLTYFDLKNLTERIECPVLMGFGLQDVICPPHTNFASYNSIVAPKRWIVFPEKGHNVGFEKRWLDSREEFFQQIIKERCAK